MALAEKERTKKTEGKASERPNLWLIIVVLAGSGLLLTALFGGHGLMRWLQFDQEKKTLTTKLEKIQEQNIRSRQEIDSLMHNEKYIETIARRDLGMVKADEIIYQFPASTEKSLPVPTVPASR